MGEFVKAVRWSAPGSVLLLTAAMVYVSGHEVSQLSWLQFHGALRTIEVSSGGAALVVFGSVPLGFLTYQLYYYAYSAPSSPVLSFVHLDVAHEVRRAGTEIVDVHEMPGWSVKFVNGLRLSWPSRLLVPFTSPRLRTLWLFEQDERDVPPDEELTSVPSASESDRPLDLRNAKARAVLKRYAEIREANWLALEAQLHAKLRNRGDADRDFGDIERLADIFHTLGASKTAVSLGWFVGTALLVWPPVGGYGVLGVHLVVVLALSLAPSALAVVALYLALHVNRAHCQSRRIALMCSVLNQSDSIPCRGGCSQRTG